MWSWPAVERDADELIEESKSVMRMQTFSCSSNIDRGGRQGKSSQEAYLYLVSDLRQQPLRPAETISPGRHERAAHAGIHQYEPLISPPQAILQQDLGVRAEVVAGIAPVDCPDPRGIGEQRVRVGLAVEDEDKVGLGMQPVGEEELEVPPGLWALAVYICDERAVVGLRGVGLFVLSDGD